MPKKFTILFLVLLFATIINSFVSAAAELTTQQKQKLDPSLRLLLAHPELVAKEGVLTPYLLKSGPEPMLPVLIKTDGTITDLRNSGVEIQSVVGDVVTANVRLRQLESLANLRSVVYVQAAKILRVQNDVSVAEIRAKAARNQYSLSGKGVIIGLADTGIDWRHQDFRKADGSTRIKYLLDFSEPGDLNGDGKLDGPDAYGGTLYTEAEINNASHGSGTVNEKDVVGHGSHVAGTAAGNGLGTGGPFAAGAFAGVAPEVDLVVVKATRSAGGSQMTDVDQINAIVFIDSVAGVLDKPYVTSLSLGGQNGAHDGTSLSEQAIDNLVGPEVAGKVVVVAAGNDGDRNIHASGTLSSQTTTIDVKFEVPSYSTQPDAMNDYVIFDIWYPGSKSLSIKLTTPSGLSYGPIRSGASPFYRDEQDGFVVIDNASGGTNVLNGDKEIQLQIFDYRESTPPRTGVWTITISGTSGHFDAWLAGATMEAQIATHLDLSMTVAIPSTARNAISVGAYITKKTWVDLDGNHLTSPNLDNKQVGDYCDFSGQGPTRDGRIKPEVAAPGEKIGSTYSADAPPDGPFSMFATGSAEFPHGLILQDNKHAIAQGTSMAVPHVAGAAALILEHNPNLDAIQVKEMLTESARSDKFTGIVPNDRWGYGKIDVLAALGVVPSDKPPTEFRLWQNYPNPFNQATTIVYSLPPGRREIYTTLQIFNVLGQRVKTLVSENLYPDSYQLLWNGQDDTGKPIPSGVYFCELKAGGSTRHIKIVIIR